MGVPLGPYQLVKRLATGGMAEIFLARREGPEGFARELVVKRILPHLAADPDFVQMFLDEARLAARLHHPNIVHVYDFGHAEGSYYLAMELVRGVDLRALLGRAGALPPHHAAKIGSFVCEALAHAHALSVSLDEGRRGLVHRDVTPSNVLLSFDGAVKLADFGIAKAQEGVDRGDSVHGVVKGKHAYLSPEQARGERLDGRSDLYNVGILLFECLVGEPLFPHHEHRLAKKLAAAGAPPGLERLSRVPIPLAAIVRRALSADPGLRHPDALALRAELEAVLRVWPEPSDAVELGAYVRALFPDVPSDEARAAGTVPSTAVVTPEGRSLPVPPPTRTPTTSAVPTEPRGRASRSRSPRVALALVALVALALVLGGGVWALVGLESAPPAPTAVPATPPAAPRPHPRAEAPLAELRVRTEPPGASIEVDGAPRGHAPIVLELESGRMHGVTARFTDGTSRREEVRLDAREVRELTLARSGSPAVEGARLRVLSSPGGATVSVGDAVLGRTPLELPVSLGRHTVRVRLEGYAPVEGEVDVQRPDEQATVSFALTPSLAPGLDPVPDPVLSRRGDARPRPPRPPRSVGAPGQLTIATTPWSEVYLGARHLGTTPLANVSLPAGRHVLTLRHPGRPDRRVPVDIEAGQVTRLRMPL